MCDCGHPRDDHTRTGFCLVVYCECIGPTSQGGKFVRLEEATE